jgi:flagellin FlaB
MGRISKILKDKEVGSIGIGAMIVFIAMVLVAGIAASVLIQTSTKLETQAMASGQQTIAEVSSGIAVTGIEGYNKSTVGKIYLMAIGVRARAGSADIDLSKAVIELSDSTTKNYFIYAGSGKFKDTDVINGDIFQWGAYPTSAMTFGVIVLQDADNSVNSTTPVINQGDHVLLTVNTSAAFGSLTTRVDVFGMVVPEEGSPGIIAFTTPASYTDKVVDLQ